MFCLANIYCLYIETLYVDNIHFKETIAFDIFSFSYLGIFFALYFVVVIAIKSDLDNIIRFKVLFRLLSDYSVVFFSRISLHRINKFIKKSEVFRR